MSTHQNPTAGPGAVLLALRITTVPLMAAPLIIGIVTWFITTGGDEPPLWALAVGALLPLIGIMVAQMIGYPGPQRLDAALDEGRLHATPESTGVAAGQIFRSSLFLRFAVTEFGILVGFALSVVVRSPWPYLLALVVGYPGLIWHVWPSRHLIERCAARLEEDGRPSYLREGFGLR